MSYGRARAPLTFETPVALSARDEFNQAAGNLSGKALPVGGSWASAGDTTPDFTIDATNDLAIRNTASDAVDGGCYATATTPTLTNLVAQVDSRALHGGGSEVKRNGLVARYVDTSNFLQAFFYNPTSLSLPVGIRVRKRVAGTFTTLAQVATPFSPNTSNAEFRTLRLYADNGGRWYLWTFLQGATNGDDPLAFGYDTTLATGGTLASGKVGMYHESNAAGTDDAFDNFVASVPAVNAVIHSTQSARFLHDIALRENAAGTSEGRVPVFEGKHLTAPPATRAARKSRIVVSARRFDVDSGLPDSGIADNLTGSLSVTPRVRLVSG